MLKPCLVCQRLTEESRCPDHVETRRSTPARRARSSSAWTKRSREVRSLGFCWDCRKQFRPADLEAHHLIPAAKYPELVSTGPVVPLCKACHQLRSELVG